MGIEELVVKHRLERVKIAAAHRRIALVLEGEDFLVAAHRQIFLAFCASLPGAFPHSITSSARASNVGGISRPSNLAAVRLMMSSNLVGCSTGMSPGFAPRRILST